MFGNVKKHRKAIVVVSFALMFCFCLLGLFENLSMNAYAASSTVPVESTDEHTHQSTGNIALTQGFSDQTRYFVKSTGAEYNGYFSTTKDSCYSIPLNVYHVHNGDSQNGGLCYETPVYHVHDASCYDGDYCSGTFTVKCVDVVYASNKYTVTFTSYCSDCGYYFDETVESTNSLLSSYKNQNYSAINKSNSSIDQQRIEYCITSVVSILQYAPSAQHLPTLVNGEDSTISLNCICGKDERTVEYYLMTCTQQTNVAGVAYGLNCTNASHNHSLDERYDALVSKQWIDKSGEIYTGYISDVKGGCFNTPVNIYHVHSGDTVNGGDCYSPVYHTHTDECYKTTKTEKCSTKLTFPADGEHAGQITTLEYTVKVSCDNLCPACGSLLKFSNVSYGNFYIIASTGQRVLYNICYTYKCSNTNCGESFDKFDLNNTSISCNSCSTNGYWNMMVFGNVSASSNKIIYTYYCPYCQATTSTSSSIPAYHTTMTQTRYIYVLRYYCSNCDDYVYDTYIPNSLSDETYTSYNKVPKIVKYETLNDLVSKGKYTSKKGTTHNATATVEYQDTKTHCGKTVGKTVDRYEFSCTKTDKDVDDTAYACDCGYATKLQYADFTDSKSATLYMKCRGRYDVDSSQTYIPGTNDWECLCNHVSGCDNKCSTSSASCTGTVGTSGDAYGTYQWRVAHLCNGPVFGSNNGTVGSRYATRYTVCNVCGASGRSYRNTGVSNGMYVKCSSNGNRNHYIQGTSDGTTACRFCGIKASSMYVGACDNSYNRTYNVNWTTTVDYTSVEEEVITNHNVTKSDCEFICSYDSKATVYVNSGFNFTDANSGAIVGYTVIEDGRIVKKLGRTSQLATTSFDKCTWTGNITSVTTLQFHIYTTAGDYYLPEINLIAKYYNMDYNYHGGRAGEKAPSKIGWSAAGKVSIPYNDGFSFVGWDVDHCDEFEHYWDPVKATKSSKHTTDEFIDYTRIGRATSFLNLRSDIGETVYLDAYWRDDNPPVWSEAEPIEPDNKKGDGKGIRYFNADGTEYVPDTWTKQTVKVVASAHDLASGIYGFKWVVDSVNLLPENKLVENALTYNRLDPIRTITEYPETSISKSGSGTVWSHKENRVYEETGEYSGTVYAKDNAEDLDFYARDGHEKFYLSNGKFNESEIDFGRVRVDKTVPEYKVEYYVNGKWVDNDEDYQKWLNDTGWTEEGGTWTKNEVIVRVTATDVHSGLDAKAFSWDQGKTWIAEDTGSGTERNDTGSWVQAHTTKTFKKNTKSTVWVKDAVGNIVVVDYEVDGIDVKAPTVYPELNPTDSDVDGEPLPKDDDETPYDYPSDTQYTFERVGELTYDWVNYDVVLQFNAKDEEHSDKDAYNVSRVREIRLYEADKDFNKGTLVKYAKGDPQVSRDPDQAPQGSVQLSYKCTKQGILYYVLEAEDNASNITTVNLTVKIDKTAPVIPEGDNGSMLFDIEDINLDKYGIDEVENKIKDTEAMKRSFLFATTDYNNPDNGLTDDIFDSSGISLFMLRLINAEDASDYKDYDITQYLAGTATNTSEFSSAHKHTADCYHKHSDACGYKTYTYRLHFSGSDLNDNAVEYSYSVVCPYCQERITKISDRLQDYISYNHECKACYACGYATNILTCKANSDIKAVLSAMFGTEINTFAEFPDAAMLKYTLTIRDRAGNETVYHNADGNEILNFSIKAVIYYAEISDEDINGNIRDDLNIEQEDKTKVWTNIPYFKAGEFGYVEAWTIGYVPKIGFDFGDVGDWAVKEITGVNEKDLKIVANDRMKVYNLGIKSDLTYARNIPVSKAVAISTAFPDHNGVPYAAHYGFNEKAAVKAQDQKTYFKYFESDGTNIRIPVHYMLKADGTKKSDGSDNYKWELREADVIAYKGSANATDKSSPLYVIWDTKLTEVHYRITHET